MVYFTRCWVQREPLWGAVRRGVKPSLRVSFGGARGLRSPVMIGSSLARKTALRKHRGEMGF